MQLIETQTLASAQASITFSDIPQTYTDLYLVMSARSSRGTEPFDAVLIKPNNVTANQSFRGLFGTGSTTGSFTDTKISGGAATASGATANTFANVSVYIPNYTSSVAKSFSTDSVTENNATNTRQALFASLWNDTPAITSLVIIPEVSTNFVQYTSASLYGILAGSDGITSVS